MKDFPFFTTEYGISSLVLKEIPYRQEAYIHIQDVQPEGLGEHLAECVSFCRMVGAQKIYAKGHPLLESFPEHTRILEMRGIARVDPQKVKCLFPVTEATVSRWRQIHNGRMQQVDGAGTLEARDEKRILDSGGAYFIHEDGTLLGIGWLEDGKLPAVAAVIPGAGEKVMHTLLSLTENSDITLEVASTNSRAIRLYEKLGFLTTGVLTVWYSIL